MDQMSDPNVLWIGIAGVVFLGIGTGAGLFLSTVLRKRGITRAQGDAKRVLDEAEKEAANRIKAIEVEAKAKQLDREKEFERDLQRRRQATERLENNLQRRESVLEKKIESADRRDKSVADKEKSLDLKLQEARENSEQWQRLRAEAVRLCEEVSGMTADQAKEMLLKNLEQDISQESAALIRRIETETKEIANKKARQIITLAIEKCATDQVSETTVSVVNLPNDEMKGRIIGREGRNIRALEAATGVNIIVDDTPEAVVLSSFDPLRREVARLTLEKLLGDGRIHPGRIEEVAAKVEKEVADQMRETGERMVFDLGIHGLHPELIKLLGRLKYRTSYGQNVLMHTQEVVMLLETMAGELGVDIATAKRAGLLHDIGKAVSYEMEGTHALIGAELAKKYNESPAVTHAIAAHHLEEEPRTVIAVLVQAADAISAARPGARRETLESYVKRLESLEKIATSYNGVNKAYALQAGREIRIAVEPTTLNDNDCAKLARDITKQIEGEMEYPGQIKVTVCREMRVTEYAK